MGGPPPRLTLCLIARDEEDLLARCLTSVRGVADEIVFVDTGSTDRTLEIARSFGAQVFTFPWTGSFAAARNFSLDQARGQWILVLDADEELQADDRAKLLALVERSETSAEAGPEGYFLVTISYTGDVPGDEGEVDLRLSLFRNRSGYRYRGAIHEDIADSIRGASGSAERRASDVTLGITDIRVLHYGYLTPRWIGKQKSRRNTAALRSELSLTPDDPFLHYSLGAELVPLQDYDGALREFEVARTRWTPEAPQYPDLVKKIAACWMAKADYWRGREVLRLGVGMYPDFTDLWYLLGWAELLTRNYRGSADCYRRCLELGPPPPRYSSSFGVGGVFAHYGLAQVSLARAAEVLRAGVSARPASAALVTALRRTRSLLLAGGYHEAQDSALTNHIAAGKAVPPGQLVEGQ
ncbi:MAG: glycosyltransferase [Bacillota bacterium]